MSKHETVKGSISKNRVEVTVDNPPEGYELCLLQQLVFAGLTTAIKVQKHGDGLKVSGPRSYGSMDLNRAWSTIVVDIVTDPLNGPLGDFNYFFKDGDLPENQ